MTNRKSNNLQEPIQMGPIDRDSLCLRREKLALLTGPKKAPLEDEDRIQSPKCILNKRQMGNVQNYDSYITISSSQSYRSNFREVN
jgi:hypothetical protein